MLGEKGPEKNQTLGKLLTWLDVEMETKVAN